MEQENDKRILVCFAVKEEAAFFNPPPHVAKLITGMGERNAVERISSYCQKAGLPRLIISSGFAGALNPALLLGDIVCQFDERTTQNFPGLLKVGKPVSFLPVQKVIITQREKQSLFAESQRDVLDMESEAITKWCGKNAVPNTTIRVISDTAQEDLPLDFNAFTTPDLKINLVALVLHVLMHPGKIGPLMTFQKRTKLAARALGEALKTVTDGRLD